MKKFILIFALIFLGYNTSLAKDRISEPSTQLTLEIKKLLESQKFKFQSNKIETNAVITLTVNNNNEIVIIEVSSEFKSVETYEKTD